MRMSEETFDTDVGVRGACCQHRCSVFTLIYTDGSMRNESREMKARIGDSHTNQTDNERYRVVHNRKNENQNRRHTNLIESWRYRAVMKGDLFANSSDIVGNQMTLKRIVDNFDCLK